MGCFGTKKSGVSGRRFGVVNPAARSIGKYLGVCQGSVVASGWPRYRVLQKCCYLHKIAFA